MENITFEQALTRLDEISKILNSGASLEKSMELYEEGTRLASFCAKKLNDAEQKLKRLDLLKENESDD